MKRPEWLTIEEERLIRRTLRENGKLHAVKALHLMKGEKGIADWGLKECKEYCDGLPLLAQPGDALAEAVTKLREAEEELKACLKESFGIDEERAAEVMRDQAALVKLMNNVKNAEKFGI